MSSSNLIQTNATCALDNWGEFYLVCFCISIHLKASAKEKLQRTTSDGVIFRERMKGKVFVDNATHSA